jgi:uncharacterized membrane protein (UPF0136 family)
MLLMRIVMVLIVLALLATVGGLAYWGYVNQQVWLMALIPGLAAGLLLWLASMVRLPFPVASIALVLIAVLLIAGCWWAYRATDGAFVRLLVVGVGTIVVLYAPSGPLSYWLNREVVRPLEVLNPEGEAGTALVAYHPGKSSFQRDVSHAFAEGLASKGWRVEITTASSEAPTDLSGYDLLVLGAPTYDWLPAKRLQTYVKGLGDLAAQPTVTIISGAGYTELSQPAMEELVREANGELVESLAVWSARPNDEIHGISDPLNAMRQAARAISLP